jgi:hypothetical protein
MSMSPRGKGRSVRVAQAACVVLLAAATAVAVAGDRIDAPTRTGRAHRERLSSR